MRNNLQKSNFIAKSQVNETDQPRKTCAETVCVDIAQNCRCARFEYCLPPFRTQTIIRGMIRVSVADAQGVVITVKSCITVFFSTGRHNPKLNVSFNCRCFGKTLSMATRCRYWPNVILPGPWASSWATHSKSFHAFTDVLATIKRCSDLVLWPAVVSMVRATGAQRRFGTRSREISRGCSSWGAGFRCLQLVSKDVKQTLHFSANGTFPEVLLATVARPTTLACVEKRFDGCKCSRACKKQADCPRRVGFRHRCDTILTFWALPLVSSACMSYASVRSHFS